MGDHRNRLHLVVDGTTQTAGFVDDTTHKQGQGVVVDLLEHSNTNALSAHIIMLMRKQA